MKQLLRLALLALLIPPALAGGSEPRPDDLAAGTLAPAVRHSAPSETTEPGSNASLSPSLMIGLFIGSALFSLTLHVALRHHRRSVRQLDRVRKKQHLMTPAEREFHSILEPVVRPYGRISLKVRLADLFEIRPERGRQSAYHLISNQHIDFLVTEHGTSRILCGIELDDRSHQRPDRQKRDAFVNQLFASQDLPLVRIRCARRYDPEVLRETLAGIFGKAHAGLHQGRPSPQKRRP